MAYKCSPGNAFDAPTLKVDDKVMTIRYVRPWLSDVFTAQIEHQSTDEQMNSYDTIYNMIRYYIDTI